jgi:predicted nicotinamide N-methyase
MPAFYAMYYFMKPAMTAYQTKRDTIDINHTTSLLIQSLLDRNQFSDDEGAALAQGISSAAWPLFGLVWPSGIVLAQEMCVRELAGRKILEIGCGLGLASLIAKQRGADICASDAHPLTQLFLNNNATLNDIENVPYSEGCWHKTYPSLGRFDFIIGSDVLYERDEAGVLAGFIGRHANPTCEVLSVDPNRGNRSHFKRHMAQQNFTLSETPVLGKIINGAAYKGRLMQYVRK